METSALKNKSPCTDCPLRLERGKNIICTDCDKMNAPEETVEIVRPAPVMVVCRLRANCVAGGQPMARTGENFYYIKATQKFDPTCKFCRQKKANDHYKNRRSEPATEWGKKHREMLEKDEDEPMAGNTRSTLLPDVLEILERAKAYHCNQIRLINIAMAAISD